MSCRGLASPRDLLERLSDFFFFFFRTGLRRQSDPRSVRGSGRRHFDRGAHGDLPKQ